jgi:hypothetical protein
MKVETKFNIGDIVYFTWDDNYIIKSRIEGMEVKSHKRYDNISKVKYITDFSSYSITEDRLFTSAEECRQSIIDSIQMPEEQ